MTDLQYEILGILCQSKSVPTTEKFYEKTVNFFGQTIELVDHLTGNMKKMAAISTELDMALKTLHDQLKVWMEWFYLTSSPEIVWYNQELTLSIDLQLLQRLLNLLQMLEINVPKVLTIKESKLFTPSHLTLTNAKTWIMRVINNLIYDNGELQNKVRELNFLPLLLTQCNIDDNNPYLRELGIFAVRNLTINNPENAKLVKSLSPKGAAPNPALDELGLEIATDFDGLPRIRRKI